MSPLEEALLFSRPEVSVETLKATAASAARGYLSKQASLNESIADSAKELRLNNHQIDRVAQAANTLVFRAKYAAAEAHKVIEFPVADPAVIKKMANYVPAFSRPATVVTKTAQYIPGAAAVARLAPAKVKTANYAPENFSGDLSRTYLDLVSVKPQLSADVAGAKARVKTAGYALVEQARHLIENDEADFYDVVDAISQVAQVPALIKVAADLLADSLQRTRSLRVKPGFEKRAGRRADPGNALCVQYRAFEDAVVDVQARQEVLREFQEQSTLAKTAMMNSVDVEHGMLKTAGPYTGSGWQKFLKGIGFGTEVPGASTTVKKVVENYTHAAQLAKAKEIALASTPNPSLDRIARSMKSAGDLLGQRTREVEQAVTAPSTFEPTAFAKGLRFAGLAGAGGITAHIAANAYEKSKEKALFGSSFEKALKNGKDLNNMDRDTLKKNFEVLWRFAPDMAQQPTVASSFLRQASFRSDLGVDPNTVKMLADIQKAHSEGSGAQGKGNIAGALRSLAGMSGIAGGA